VVSARASIVSTTNFSALPPLVAHTSRVTARSPTDSTHPAAQLNVWSCEYAGPRPSSVARSATSRSQVLREPSDERHCKHLRRFTKVYRPLGAIIFSSSQTHNFAEEQHAQSQLLHLHTPGHSLLLHHPNTRTCLQQSELDLRPADNDEHDLQQKDIAGGTLSGAGVVNIYAPRSTASALLALLLTNFPTLLSTTRMALSHTTKILVTVRIDRGRSVLSEGDRGWNLVQ